MKMFKLLYVYMLECSDKSFYVGITNDYDEAIEWETRLKKWSRKKKEALVRENWKAVQEASICNNETTHTNLVSSSGVEN